MERWINIVKYIRLIFLVIHHDINCSRSEHAQSLKKKWWNIMKISQIINNEMKNPEFSKVYLAAKGRSASTLAMYKANKRDFFIEKCVNGV